MANDQNAHALVDKVALRALNVQLQAQLGYRQPPRAHRPLGHIATGGCFQPPRHCRQ